MQGICIIYIFLIGCREIQDGQVTTYTFCCDFHIVRSSSIYFLSVMGKLDYWLATIVNITCMHRNK